MQICKYCLMPMVGVMSFSKGRREKFNQCKKCYIKTKPKDLKESDLVFEDVLYKVAIESGKYKSEGGSK